MLLPMFAAADLESLTWQGALTIIVVAIANWIQTRATRGEAESGARQGAAAGVNEGVRRAAREGAEEAVRPLDKKMDQVHETVNGGGLTAAVTRVERGIEDIKAEQKTHGESDAEQFRDMRRYMGMPDRPPGG